MNPQILAVSALLLAALPAQNARVAVGERMPDVELAGLANGDGRTKLSEFRGQPVVVDFWGTR